MRELSRLLSGGRKGLAEALGRARTMPLPPLHNMRAGAPLSDFLLEEPLVNDPDSFGGISADWINAFMRQLSQVEGRTKRLHFKSLGALLARQEAIAEAWTHAPIPVPVVPPLPQRPLLEYDIGR